MSHRAGVTTDTPASIMIEAATLAAAPVVPRLTAVETSVATTTCRPLLQRVCRTYPLPAEPRRSHPEGQRLLRRVSFAAQGQLNRCLTNWEVRLMTAVETAAVCSALRTILTSRAPV